MNRSHVQPNEIKAEAAKTIKEACELAEAGFRYVTEMEGAKIFGKRKLGVKRK